MDTTYDDFKLSLAWKGDPNDEKKGEVRVTYHPSQGNDVEGPFKPYSTKLSPEDKFAQLIHVLENNPNSFRSMENLREAGKEVANLLLPSEGEIRQQFRESWQDHRVRLRLIYPAQKEDYEPLLRIPWEYIYLLDSDDNGDIEHGRFLGINENISIVHCIPEPPGDADMVAGVSRLPANMAYLSALDMSRQKNLDSLEEKLIQHLKDSLQGIALGDDRKREIEDSVRSEFDEAREAYEETLSQSPKALEEALLKLLSLKDALSRLVNQIQDIDAEAKKRIIESVNEEYERIDLEDFRITEEVLQDNDEAFKDFVEEMGVLQEVLTCPNITGGKPPPAEPGDVTRALEDSHLVYIICHGNPATIQLKDENLKASELLEYLESKLKTDQALPDAIRKQLKAVLFISCSSAHGPGSIALLLHQLGVPVVIGTSNSISVGPATNFVDGFFKAIVHGSLEWSVVNGRLNMFQQLSSGDWYVGFGLPRLYLRSEDGTLVPQDLLFGTDDMVRSFDKYIDSKLADVEEVKLEEEDTLKKLLQWIVRDRNLHEEELKKKWYHVAAAPGAGKTTQIAWLVRKLQERNGSPPCIYHFCIPEFPDTGDRLKFITHSLVPQLLRYFGEENYSNWCSPGKFPLLVGRAEDALDYFVIQPLKKAREEGNLLPVIIIDNIDLIPSGEPESNTILNLLLGKRDFLDDVARFIITTDEEYPEREITAYDLTLRRRPDLVLLLRAIGRFLGRIGIQEQVESVLTRLESVPIVQSPVKDLRDIMASDIQAVEPVPLPLLDQFKERLEKYSPDIVPQIPDEVASSAQRLDALIKGSLQKIQQKNPRQAEQIRQLLNTLAVAYEPLTPNVVAQLIGLSPAREIEGLIEQVEPFLFTSEAFGGSLALYHASIKKSLLDRPDGLAAAHESLVKAYRQAYRPPDGNWAGITDWSWSRLSGEGVSEESSREQSRYAQCYLASHAYECYQATEPQNKKARRTRANDFLTLVCAPGFRTVRLVEVGLQTALQDVRRGLRVAFAEYVLLTDVEAPRALAAFDHLLTAISTDDDLALVSLEETLRRENGGVPALLEFLGLKEHAEKQ